MKPERMTETQKAELLSLLKSVPELVELSEAVRLHFVAENMDEQKALPADRSASVEMLSIWFNLATSTSQIGCRPSVLPDPEGWGHVLAGIARNVSQKWPGKLEPDEILRRIRAGFDAGWAKQFGAKPGVH